jgi:cyclopropane-fatty-acyl-phospholipid synthase
MKTTLQDLLRALNKSVPGIPFKVDFWDGDSLQCGEGEPAFTLTFKTRGAAASILSKGTLGFGEEYVNGNILVQGDFKELMRLGTDPHFQGLKLPLRTKLAVLIEHIRSMNTVRRSPVNIAHHYSRGNEFYKLYLDESLTYSCAYFRSPDDTLEQAQRQKYEHICRKLQLKEGETLVDVGCGFGGMLIHAARNYGVQGTGCTLSTEQAEYARQRIKTEGLEKSIQIHLEDYRNLPGRFDKFVSIGMFEHVGEKFIPLFMEKTQALLKPGGQGLLHTIGKELDTPGDAWTMRYIFPGAFIPILDHVIRTMGKNGLVPVDIENLRLHYAATLDEWARRFDGNARRIEEMFSGEIVRMWRMYLNGSAAIFRNGDIRVYQILFTNGLNNGLPLTREHVYCRPEQ